MVDARRGASWAYVVGYAGDGANPPEACVVEAGKAGSEEEIDCRGYPPDWVLRLLPQDDAQHPAFQNGLMVRPHDFDYPSAYLCDVNPGLWEEKLGRDPYPEAFTERGYIGECPESYYFPPQRETRDDVLVAANAFLIPRMRLCSMYKSTNLVVASRCRDLQWRYDRLNQLILDTLEQEGKIGYDRARALIDFLSPLGPYNPDYYATAAPRDKDTGDPAIEGSVSLCDLTDRTIESHFGYYPDDWVKIDLTHYV